MQAIILAGGLGTRLRSVLADVPKPMAPIHGKPFLAYLLDYLQQQGFKRIILSVHYLREQIENYFKNNYQELTIGYAIEANPLGTGGAIINSLQKITNDEPCFIINGDTLAKLDFQKMQEQHIQQNSLISIAVRKVENCNRYGQAIMDDNFNIIEFHERGESKSGFINAGVYLINKTLFANQTLSDAFSFEKDFLFKNLAFLHPKAFIAEDYFIDIGIPEDYKRVQNEFIKDLL